MMSKPSNPARSCSFGLTAVPFRLAPARPAAAAAQVPPHPPLLPCDGGGGRVRDPGLPARPTLPPAAEQAPRTQDQTSQAEEAPFTGEEEQERQAQQREQWRWSLGRGGRGRRRFRFGLRFGEETPKTKEIETREERIRAVGPQHHRLSGERIDFKVDLLHLG